ncbi:hypothetical protein SMMN14_08901 [Sphaerulina musiva]
MQFFALLATAALAAAAPSVLETRGGEKVCASGAPYCCQLDVLGVAAVSCSDVPGSPKSVDEFNKECKHTGLSAQCCEVGGIADLALLCTTPL